MKNQIGVTIIEVLIAFAILAFGVMTLLQFQNSSLRMANLTHRQNEAYFLAEKKLNETKHFVELTSTPSVADYNDIAVGQTIETYTGLNTTYTITTNVTEDTTLNYKEIAVTVTWTDPNGSTVQSVSLNSVIGKTSVEKSGEYLQGK